MNNDIPSIVTEAVLSCLYSNKSTFFGNVDIPKLRAACYDLSIGMKSSRNTQWDLDFQLETDNLQHFLSSGEFSDVIFVVEGEKLCGHRAIVCCHSEVLSAMLSGGFAESHQKEVRLRSTQPTPLLLHRCVCMHEYVYARMYVCVRACMCEATV